ncbi:MAG: hypothetical protein U1F36_04250 [Planctomycetota bacterium]
MSLKASLWLGWRSLVHHRTRSLLLLLATTLIALLPLVVSRLFTAVEAKAQARAESTPIVLGRKGSRFDLVLGALWFRGRTPEALQLKELDRVRTDGLAEPVPMLARNTALGQPLVGTTPDYFARRGLRFASGDLPVGLGECVVGADLAAMHKISVGDAILSDRRNPLAIDEGYPLRMHVVGVLARAGTADDGAIFASLETLWVVEGIGHGHGEAEEQPAARVMRREGDKVVLDSGVVQYQEVTPQNLASFHFHTEADQLPLTAVLVFPRDAKASAMLLARYRVLDDVQAIEPRAVVDELTGYVLGLKRFLDVQTAMVTASTLLLLLLIVMLTLRLRSREIETLGRIGAPSSVLWGAFGFEFGSVILAGFALAAVLAVAGVALLQETLPWL